MTGAVTPETGVDAAERAAFDFTKLAVTGSLGSVDAADVVAMVKEASARPDVMANAFGTDLLPGDSGQSLARRMMGVYADMSARRMVDDDLERARRDSERTSRETGERIRSYLGLSDDDVARMDFDAEHGDLTPRLLARERFLFG